MTAAPPPGDDSSRHPEEFLTWPDGGGAHLLVPDDISELDADVLAWRRERTLAKRARRRASWSRWVPMSWRKYGATAPVLIVSMLLIGAFGAMLVLFGPRGRTGDLQAASPLASPTVQAGQVGGLLPQTTLETLTDTYVGTRALDRPALLLLVPAACTDCAAVVRHVLSASEPYALMRYVVGATATQARTLTETGGRSVIGLVDRGAPDGGEALIGQLVTDTTAPAIAVIGSNGALRVVLDDVTADTALTGELDKALAPALSARAAH